MNRYPEYVACIRNGGNDRRQDFSKCGRDGLGFFQSTEHAKNSRAYGSRLVACPDCLRILGETDFAASEEALIDMADVDHEEEE